MSLKNRTDIVIKLADDGSDLVVLSQQLCLEESASELSNSNFLLNP